MSRTILLASINQTLVLVGTPPVVALGSPYSYTFEARFGSGNYTFTETGSLPTGLSFTDNGDGTATISGTTSVPGNFPFSLAVQDTDRNRISKSFTLVVQPLPLSISGHISGGIAGAAASGSYSASGGVSPYTFTVISGTFPTTGGLSSAGVAQGNWSSPAFYSWVVRVTDSLGATADLSDSTTISYATLSLSGSFVNIYDNGDAGSAAGSIAITGGSGSYSIGSTTGALPTGLSAAISGSNLVLSGTCSAYGSFTFTVTVHSSDGQNATTSSQTIIVGDPHYSSLVSKNDWSGTVSAGIIHDQIASPSDFSWSLVNSVAPPTAGAGPFGDYALVLNGSNQFAFITASGGTTATLSMGSSDYVIEQWVNSATAANLYQCMFDFRPPSTNGLYPSYFLNVGAAVGDMYLNGSDNISSISPSPSSNTWYHAAIVRTGGKSFLLFNGNVIGFITDTNTYASPASGVIGIGGFDHVNNPFDGKFAQWRVTKGYGQRYGNATALSAPGATYTIPTRAFQNGGV